MQPKRKRRFEIPASGRRQMTQSAWWSAEVKPLRGKKQPLSSAGLHALRDESTRSIAPARALAAEALTLERKLKAKG